MLKVFSRFASSTYQMRVPSVPVAFARAPVTKYVPAQRSRAPAGTGPVARSGVSTTGTAGVGFGVGLPPLGAGVADGVAATVGRGVDVDVGFWTGDGNTASDVGSVTLDTFDPITLNWRLTGSYARSRPSAATSSDPFDVPSGSKRVMRPRPSLSDRTA